MQGENVERTPSMPGFSVGQASPPLLNRTHAHNGSYGVFVYVLTFLSCIGGFLFGYDTGVISAALVLISDEFGLNEVQQELIVSCTVGAAIIGAAFAGPINDRFGRKPAIFASSIFFFVGAVAMALAPDFQILLVGRLIVGLGVGVASMSMPVYVSEAAPLQIRGGLVTCINVAITGGQFVSSIVGGIFSEMNNGWRYLLGLAAIPALIQFFGFLILPESPRWLVHKNKNERALKALTSLRGQHYPVEAEMLEIRQSVEEQENVSHIDVRAELSKPAVSRALVVGCALQLAQQLCGINTVMYYSATILRLAGFTAASTAIWLAAVVSFCNFLGSGIGLYLVDRVGRRKLALTSLSLVCVTLGALSATFYYAHEQSKHVEGFGQCSRYSRCFDCVADSDCGFCSSLTYPKSSSSACVLGTDDGPSNSSACNSSDFNSDTCPGSTLGGWFIFLSLCLYLLCFAPGMGTMPWTINSEIYPLNVRGVCNAIATCANWIANLAMSMTFLTLSKALTSHGAFALYALIAFGFFLFLIARLPETAGKSLEEIQGLFTRPVVLECTSSYRRVPGASTMEPSVDDDMQ